MNKDFSIAVQEVMRKYPKMDTGIFTEGEIAALPQPVQAYFRYCGYIGKKKMTHARIVWSRVLHKRSVRSNWMQLAYDQFNCVPEPLRIVQITSKIGIASMEISERYQDGMGIWRMRLLKMLNLIDAKGRMELNRTALATFLSEALIIPAIALQPYIEWVSIDALTAKAIIRHNETEVSGKFHFNTLGELVRFETDDRYNSEDGKLYTLCKWSGICENYMEANGVRFPSSFKAVWHLENEDFEYFNGRISAVIFEM